MHEFTIAKEIIMHLNEFKKRQNDLKIIGLNIELGEFTFANEEQIKFWLKELLKDTNKININIKRIKPIVYCNKCGYSGNIKFSADPLYHFLLPDLRCEKCNSKRIDLIKGRECNLKSVKVKKTFNKKKKLL
ncbi:MAG: hydrogenase maturation nickel metallochaperone HypA [bacterium]|nr:hydrogenase maturation nickel metallochaperone HypA [bacterium]